MRIERVLAPNPGPFTGPGTNTWILDGDGGVLVIDPGPLRPDHADAVVERIGDRRTVAVLVTHTHEDHAPLANPLARDLGVPTYGHRPGPGFDPDAVVADGSSLSVGQVQVTVVHTPGHSDDHVCFLADRVLFTGDHIMGGSSVMVESMAPYLRSLDKLRRFDLDTLYPGHGEVLDDPRGVIDWYVAHRLERERQVREAVRLGAESIDAIVAEVYRDVDRSLHPLAARSVAAHVEKLVVDEELVVEGERILPSGGRA